MLDIIETKILLKNKNNFSHTIVKKKKTKIFYRTNFLLKISHIQLFCFIEILHMLLNLML